MRATPPVRRADEGYAAGEEEPPPVRRNRRSTAFCGENPCNRTFGGGESLQSHLPITLPSTRGNGQSVPPSPAAASFQSSHGLPWSWPGATTHRALCIYPFTDYPKFRNIILSELKNEREYDLLTTAPAMTREQAGAQKGKAPSAAPFASSPRRLI
jgi:hypothetical protein